MNNKRRRKIKKIATSIKLQYLELCSIYDEEEKAFENLPTSIFNQNEINRRYEDLHCLDCAIDSFEEGLLTIQSIRNIEFDIDFN